MRPTSALAGASRLPLTTKRGNKDFYKGTGQSRVPGAGHRTGPPGVHVVGGKAKYRLLDEKVRVFVGPGSKVLRETELRPYVGTQSQQPGDSPSKVFNPFARSSDQRPKLPSFSPNVLPPSDASKLSRRDFTLFSKRYQELRGDQKHALIMDARRNWFNEMSRLYSGGSANASSEAAEETRTKEIEDKVQGAETSNIAPTPA